MASYAHPHDLRQALRIVLVGLIHLHLQRSASMPGVKANNVEPTCAQLMHKPRAIQFCRSGLGVSGGGVT